MKRPSSSKQPRNGGRFAAVFVMLLLWLGLWALEVSPDLHHFLHKDAQDPNHECLITQLQHHSVIAGFVPVAVPTVPADGKALVSPCKFHPFVSLDYRLSPGRAPPV